MRFKLILEVNKRAFGGMLPINYQYEQSAAIYKILSGADEAYASWLHDNGFRLESGKTFKLFVYSRFKIENFRILRDTERLQIFSDTVEWQVGFLPEKSTEKFIQGVFQDQVFRSYARTGLFRKDGFRYDVTPLLETPSFRWEDGLPVTDRRPCSFPVI